MKLGKQWDRSSHLVREAVEGSCRGQVIVDEEAKDGGSHHVSHRHVCGQLDVL